ncbi:MAG: hypothetical protein L0Y50_01255 [Beijerinckiaceae bacterium]|nr:hypothetical protein [Beijerinckiaceae bacterium]
MSPRLTIHAGANKTGTSAIQNFLKHNSGELRADGVIVPDQAMEIANPVDGHQVWYFDQRKGQPKADCVKELTQKIDTLLALPNAKQVIVSAENLGNIDCDYSSWFAAVAKKHDVELVIYVRRQDEFLLSSWQQWHAKTCSDMWAWITGGLGIIGNWRLVIEQWERIVGREKIHVCIFEPGRLRNKDVVEDFCRFILADTGPLVNDRSRVVNPSYKEALVDLVRGGEFFKNAHDNDFYNFMAHFLGTMSHKRNGGSIITYEQRVALVNRYAKVNAWVRENYFASSDVPGTLFTMPRPQEYVVPAPDDLRREQVQMLAKVIYEMHKRGKQ